MNANLKPDSKSFSIIMAQASSMVFMLSIEAGEKVSLLYCWLSL